MADESLKTQTARDLDEQARQTQRGIVGEFVDFLLHNKKMVADTNYPGIVAGGTVAGTGGHGSSAFHLHAVLIQVDAKNIHETFRSTYHANPTHVGGPSFLLASVYISVGL